MATNGARIIDRHGRTALPPPDQPAIALAQHGAPFAVRLDREAPVAIHEQISTAMRRQIRTGSWPAHFRLVPEPELAESLAVSRGTVRRALRTLIAEGLLVQIRGRGTFVVGAGSEQPFAQELLSLSEGLDREGTPYESIVLSQVVETPPRLVAGLLGLRSDQEAFGLRRVRKIDGTPVAYLVNWVRMEGCPGIEHFDFEQETLFGVLEGRYDLEIAIGRRTFEAQAAFGPAAQFLEIPVGAPVLYLEQLTYLADGTQIEYSDVWIRGDRLRLSSLLTRRRSKREV